jgi:hypothetical protein
MTPPPLQAWLLAVSLLAACKPSDGRDDRILPGADSAMAQKISSLVLGEEKEVAPGTFMTMNRQQATAPTGDGWHRAESAGGGFAVELPLAFNDFRIRSEATDGVEIRSHSVGAKTKGLLAWTATCVARRDGAYGPGGAPAMPDRTEVKGDPPKAYQRTLAVDARTCVLILEAQGTDPLPPEADRLRFLRSFQVTSPPKW